jgi:cytochrome P450
VLDELDSRAREGYLADHGRALVTFAEAQELGYLDACIKEVYRLHPAPGLLLERVVPKEGAENTGRRVQGETVVGCNPWMVHRWQEVLGRM